MNSPASPSRDRLSVLTAVILLAYALARFLDLPTRVFHTNLFGSPLGLELSGPLLMMLLVAALISTGSDTLIRSHPRLRARAAAAGLPAPGARPTLAGLLGDSTVVHWILPGATALVLGAVLNRLPNGPLWWAGLGLSALALITVLIAEYTLVDPDDPHWQWAALGLTALSYALALILFALLRSVGARAVVGGSIGGLVAAALAFRLYVLKSAPLARAALYTAIVGIITAQAIWALSYWRVSPSSAGLLAMIPFYLSVGISQQHLSGRLTRRLWLEYGAVGALGLAIALLYAFV